MAAEDELLKLLDALAFCAEPAFAINERHRIVFWNRAIRNLLGWTYDDVVGKSCGTVLAGSDHFGNRYCCDACPIIAIAQRDESIRQFGLNIRTKDNNLLPVDIMVLKFVFPETRRMALAHIVQPAKPKPAELAPPQPLLATYADARIRDLTAREIEVLGMLAEGLGNKAIAARLGISTHTAKFHVASILAKLGAGSRTEAVTMGMRRGLVVI
jgi:DNA-binding CsgD family transcriptional regulator